ncbi:MAG: FecR domain-containing protein [Burkholderiales bacterium]|nr:FecR domain-containing protein [Burkholderiales bacterium]
MHFIQSAACAAIIAACALPVAAQVAEIGRIKVVRGQVSVERAGKSLPAVAGMPLQAGDEIRTGRDGAAGITMSDNSLLSTGPDSTLALDRFAFDTTTHQGRFDSSLKRGTLAVSSGKIARQSPESMSVKTPAAILGVRGTEFVVSAGDAAAR